MKAVLIFCILICGSAPGADLTPYALDCHAGQFSWKLKSERAGDRPSGYQILVAGAPEKLLPGAADLWDSGRLNKPDEARSTYGGKPLPAFAHVWWKVGVWSPDVRAPSWSEPAEWSMGLVAASDRKGDWISSPDDALRAGPMPIFRRQFSVPRSPRRAVLLLSGMGFAEARINGAKVGADVLSPAWTNYHSTVLYATYDVTTQLKLGPNVLAILLGNGFYNVVGGRYSKYTGSFGTPRVWAQLHLEFTDGANTDVATDRSWRSHPGPITFSDTFGGEDFDARLEPNGWDRAGFDDSAWPRANPIEAPGGELRADTSPAIRVREVFRPIHISQPKPGVFVYDLAQNFSGWPEIVVSGAAGTRVRLTPGELLDSSGLVSQQSSGGGPTYFEYTLKGSGRERWAPRFSYYGFRYVQVEGAAPASEHQPTLAALHELTGQFLYLDAEQTGHFECSNERLNRIHALIVAAMKSNLQHVLTDCPHREKLGWLEVSYLMGPSLLYDFDLRRFLPKVEDDIHDAQTIDGLIPSIAPEYVVFSGGFRDSPEWGSAGVFLPSLEEQYYGDPRSLSASYPTMARYAKYLWSKSRDGLLEYGLGDWYDIGPGSPGVSKLTPRGLTATATYYADLTVLARTAKRMGNTADAVAWDRYSRRAKEAFQKAFYNEARQSYGSGSQTSLAMPLALGLAPESARPALLNKLVSDIRHRGNHTTAGDVGYHYVVQSLLDAGRSDVIFDMVTEKTAPSYAAQLASGATALTEAWDANPSSSQNHLMLGHVEQWFYAGLAGIRPNAPGSGLPRLTIQPEPVGDVTWVKASWDTVRGPVRSAWRLEHNSFFLSVEVPPGMQADVVLPVAAAARAAVTLGKAHARLEVKEKGRIAYAVDSGSYEFEVKGP